MLLLVQHGVLINVDFTHTSPTFVQTSASGIHQTPGVENAGVCGNTTQPRSLHSLPIRSLPSEPPPLPSEPPPPILRKKMSEERRGVWYTPLVFAIEQGHATLVRALMDARGEDGGGGGEGGCGGADYPLAAALRQRQWMLVGELLAGVAGAGIAGGEQVRMHSLVNHADRYGLTPLITCLLGLVECNGAGGGEDEEKERMTRVQQ